tara:strand:- start:162 stop:749 length:588 start_codon:yes stop_codon:yes gene_type:complete
MPTTRKRTLPAERVSRQIENRNFLSPTGFRFIVKRCPKSAFFCNQANIPSIDLGITFQANYLRDIPIPGDKLEFGDLTIRFLVDEDLNNYIEIQNWLRGLGFPESGQEFRDLDSEGKDYGIIPTEGGDNIYSDGTLQILSNNLVPKFQVVFTDLFPYSLSTINFDATDTDIEYFTAEASFKYTMYNLTDMQNNLL